MIRLKTLYDRLFRKKTIFQNSLYQILGYHPQNLSFYELAFQHKSLFKLNNERLEFLGDAIFDGVISHVVFQKFPNKNEGDLSQLRSKIANRSFLNEIGKKLNLHGLLKYQLNPIKIENTNLIGNTLESLIGAIYLDGGYDLAKQFIEKKIIDKHINWSQIEMKVIDYKSKIFQYAQKNDLVVEFELLNVQENQNHQKLFEIGISINSKLLARATQPTKKKAEQCAAEIAYCNLKIQ